MTAIEHFLNGLRDRFGSALTTLPVGAPRFDTSNTRSAGPLASMRARSTGSTPGARVSLAKLVPEKPVTMRSPGLTMPSALATGAGEITGGGEVASGD